MTFGYGNVEVIDDLGENSVHQGKILTEEDSTKVRESPGWVAQLEHHPNT